MENGQEMTDRTTTASIISGAGLALFGTTCCALPIALVAFGLGGAVASMVSAAPWLATVSQYKLVTFAVTGLVLGYSWWRVRRVEQCKVDEGKRLRAQKIAIRVSTIVLLISVFAAYALYPLTLWLE